LKAFNDFDGEKFKKNIEDIMSIVPSITSPKAALAFAADTGLFLLTMTQLGLGMAAFGIGQGVAGIAQKFADFDTLAIKDNVITLLSIGDMFGPGWKGQAALVGKSAIFLASMGTIAGGLAIFGAGSAVAGVADGVATFSSAGWAQSIVDNVTTLLGISSLFEGLGDAFTEGGKFITAMGLIAGGLAFFAFGSAAAGAVVGALDVTDFAFRGEGMTWSQSIVDHVKTLLSISSLKGIGADTVKFGLTMTGISTGLAAFGLGSFLAGAGDAAAGWLSKAKEGEGTWADKIKAKVTTLLSIVGGESKLQSSLDFIKVMTNLSLGLAVFTGTSFATSLVGVGTRILDFLAGDSSPVQEMLNIADSADKLEKGASALESLAVSLEKISGLKFDGKSLKLKEFGNDLMQSLPYIENAIMGSRGQDLSWWPMNKGQQFEGLASPTIDYAGAVANFQRLQSLGINVQGMPLTNGATQQLKTASSALSSSAAGVSINYINNDNSKNSAPITTNLIELKTDHAEQSQAAFSKRGFAPLGE